MIDFLVGWASLSLLTKRYYSVEGEILGDSEAGDYMRDALGSVTATCNPDTGSVWNTYRYKPYGSDLSSSGGEKPDPKFRWVGTAGYRQTSISHSASYIRARHCGQEEGRWTTVDPLWPKEKAYVYSTQSPTDKSDPSGLTFVLPIKCKGCGKTLIIIPTPGSRSGIIVGRPIGPGSKITLPISGPDCLKNAPPWAKGRNCICVNGSFFFGNNPIAPLDPCNGPRIEGIPGETHPVPVVADEGFISGSGRPVVDVPSQGNLVGRTGACINKYGKIVGVIVSDGCRASDFFECAKNACPFGSRFVWLDGSGSSQIWENHGNDPRPIIGGKTSRTRKPDWRVVDNWIIICD